MWRLNLNGMKTGDWEEESTMITHCHLMPRHQLRYRNSGDSMEVESARGCSWPQPRTAEEESARASMPDDIAVNSWGEGLCGHWWGSYSRRLTGMPNEIHICVWDTWQKYHFGIELYTEIAPSLCIDWQHLSHRCRPSQRAMFEG